VSDDKIHLYGGFTLDTARGALLRDGEDVHLRPQTYEVLKYLVENRGHLISNDKLIEELWKGRAVQDGSLGKCIEEVRKALGKGAAKYIRNVPGRGYRFDPPAEVESEKTEALSVTTEQVDILRVVVVDDVKDGGESNAGQGAGIRISGLVIALPLLLLAVIALGYWLAGQRRPGGRAAAAGAVPFGEMSISRLTTSGKIKHAAVSPDGKYVAHVTKEAGGDSLWISHVSAPKIVQIAGPSATEYVAVTFAPDGDSVYYLTVDRDKGEPVLYRVPVLGGPSSVVAKDVGPVGFSPDGSRMAFIRMYDAESRLIVADAGGKNERTLATRRQPEYFRVDWKAPAWSPDGKKIACQVRLNDERGQYETVMGVSVEDGSQLPLTSKRWTHVGQPAWLADGSGLLVTASESATAPVQVWNVTLLSGEATRVTNDLNNYYDLSLTRDSSRLAAVQDNSVSSFWVAPDGDPGRAKQVASEVGLVQEMAWTPDGRLVYRSNAGGSAEIWVMNADGSNPKQLTRGARASRGLDVSPDGRYLFFASDRAGRFNIWRADSDGANLKQLTAGDSEFYPQCTPDGRWVVFQRGEIEPRLWKVATDGGEPVQLTETRAVRPTVSPDGEMLAYHYLAPDVDGSRWRIGVVSSRGGPSLKHFDFPPTVSLRFVRWSPDRQSIAFVNNPGGVSDIWLQPLDGSPPKRLTSFNAEQILAFTWAPDGRSLAFVRGVETSDVVLIEQGRK
jgi:TolB protein